MSAQTNEARVILAIEAIQSSKKLSRRAAARFYNVPESTIRDRMNGVTHIAERRPAVQLLTEIEEEVIVQYILDLDTINCISGDGFDVPPFLLVQGA